MRIINTYIHYWQIFGHNSNGADNIRPVYFYLSAAIPAGTAAEAFHHYRIAYHFVMLVMTVMAMFTAAATTAFTAVMVLLFTA